MDRKGLHFKFYAVQTLKKNFYQVNEISIYEKKGNEANVYALPLAVGIKIYIYVIGIYKYA